MAIPGTWSITHSWSGQTPYSFPATLNADGTITVSGPQPYFGVWESEGAGVSLAIAASDPQSITAYIGLYNPLTSPATMKGPMTGTGPTGTVQGKWLATQQAEAEPAPAGELKLPGA